MQTLLDGYSRFRSKAWREQQHFYSELAEGQKPRAAVISCCDSRVDPTTIFDALAGELFVVRNVANLVPPYNPNAAYDGTSAALQFAVTILNVPNIIVMGHSRCGGITALMDGGSKNPGDFIAPWMSMAAPARARALRSASPQDEVIVCAHESIRLSIANLSTFPWIASRVAQGTLSLFGYYFEIATGELFVLNSAGIFKKYSP